MVTGKPIMTDTPEQVQITALFDRISFLEKMLVGLQERVNYLEHPITQVYPTIIPNTVPYTYQPVSLEATQWTPLHQGVCDSPGCHG